MLEKLVPANRARLIEAMQTIETLLAGEAAKKRAPGYTLRAPMPGDFGWVIKRHAELYGQEYGWKDPLEGLCAQIVADYANKKIPITSVAGSPRSIVKISAAFFSGKGVGDNRPDPSFARRPQSTRAWCRRPGSLKECISFARSAPAKENHPCGRTVC